jgi:transcriptional regulator with XRE-family HTH domain
MMRRRIERTSMARPYVTRIFEILESRGQSKKWFAAQMGINRTQLYQINWGDRPLTPEFIERSAQILQVPPDMLFFSPSKLRVRTETVRSGISTEVPA